MLFNRSYFNQLTRKTEHKKDEKIAKPVMDFIKVFFCLIENMQATNVMVNHPDFYSKMVHIDLGIRSAYDREDVLLINDQIIDVIMPHIKTEYNKGWEDTVFRFLCGASAYFLEQVIDQLALLAHEKQIKAVAAKVDQINKKQSERSTPNRKKAMLEIKALEEGLQKVLNASKKIQRSMVKEMKAFSLPGTKQDKIINDIKKVL